MKKKDVGKVLLGGLIVAMLLVSVPALAATEYHTKDSLLAQAKEVIQEITVEEAFSNYFEPSKAGVVFLDIRAADEVEEGHVPGATWLDRAFLEFKVESMFPERDAQMLVVYCRSGGRSALGAETLVEMGYNAVSMGGGFLAWQDKHYPVRRGVISASGGGCG